MASTPILAIPYPVGTDRVMDGDNAMQAIAERVEAVGLSFGWALYNEASAAATQAAIVLGAGTIVLKTGRRYLLVGYGDLLRGGAGEQSSLQIQKDGLAVVQASAATVVNNVNVSPVCFVVVDGDGASHPIVLYGLRATGSSNISGAGKLLVLDIGKTSAPI